MEDLYDLYLTDHEMEAGHGITLSFGKAKVHVRRAGGSNIKYTEMLRKLTNPVRRQMQNDTLDTNAMNLILQKAYARTVILGWEGVTNRQREELPFNEQNFIQVMADLPDFWTHIMEECTRLANFRIASNQEDGENLGNSSSGIPSGGVH